MKRFLAVLMFVALWSTQAFASTYYIAAAGGSDSNAGTTGSRWATFVHAWTVMHGGDTLIVGNGTYTQEVRPPASLSGSSGAYTTIQAENTKGATVDGSTVTPAYNSTLELDGGNGTGISYVQVIGMKFASGPNLTGGQEPVLVYMSNHIKLIKIAGYNAPCNVSHWRARACFGLYVESHQTDKNSWIQCSVQWQYRCDRCHHV